MKIFFSFSLRGISSYGSTISTIQRFIKSQGYSNTNEELIRQINDDPQLFYEQYEGGEQNIHSMVFKKIIAALQKSDIGLFEASTPSISTGFLVERLIQENKPVIVLHHEKVKPHFFLGFSQDNFQLVSYTIESLELKLNNAIKRAFEQADKRFNFFISPDLLAYLNKVSHEQRISKSIFIRNLIKDHMKKNR